MDYSVFPITLELTTQQCAWDLIDPIRCETEFSGSSSHEDVLPGSTDSGNGQGKKTIINAAWGSESHPCQTF